MTLEGYFPPELKRAINAIDNEIRMQLVVELLKKDELSYTQLLNILNIRKGSLTHHLIELAKGTLIRNYAKEEVTSEYESFYSLTRFGEFFIDTLHMALYPPQPYHSLPRIEAPIEPLGFPTDDASTKSIGTTQYEKDPFSNRT